MKAATLLLITVWSISGALLLPPDNLVLYCSFDSSTVHATYVENLADSSISPYLHGNCIRSTDRDGNANQALSFDGQTYLACVVPASVISQVAGGDFTLGIMVNTTHNTGTMDERFDVAGMGDAYNNGFFLSVNASRARFFLGNHGYYDTPDSICDGRWHFLIAVRSNGKVSLYLDGKMSDSGAYVDSVRPVTDTFTIGKHGIKNTSYFQGTLDELFFYKRALTPDEVITLCTSVSISPLKMYSPGDTVLNNPIVFRWSQINKTIAYALEIDTSPAFANPILSVPIEDTTYQCTTSLSPNKYYYRIGSNTDDMSPFYFFDPRYFIQK